jgi:hypothetical protein
MAGCLRKIRRLFASAQTDMGGAQGARALPKKLLVFQRRTQNRCRVHVVAVVYPQGSVSAFLVRNLTGIIDHAEGRLTRDET